MKLLRTLRVLLAFDNDGEEQALDRTESFSSADANTYAEQNSGQLVIASAATKAIPFGDVTTAKALFISSDMDLTITLNGGAETFTLRAPAGARGVLYWEGSFTAVSITNAGVSAAKVIYAVAGV